MSKTMDKQRRDLILESMAKKLMELSAEFEPEGFHLALIILATEEGDTMQAKRITPESYKKVLEELLSDAEEGWSPV